ncbi:MAG: hypothetical protein ABS46_11330 [Cytophagaceae bacterium SCN 52-12]|nr:MAG: hypothetical protein ABS46_11330 [Cytophagaceae bacterium SCN 52-12]
MDIVLAKLAICGLSVLLILPALGRERQIGALAAPVHPMLWVAGLWLVFRLLPFLLVFIFLGISPTSDVNGFWYMAENAAAGKLVYRDFWSPYSPFYSYVLAAGALVWHNPKVIVLIMLVMEGVAVALSYFFYRPVLTKAAFCFRSLIYFILPGSLILCVLGAQEDIWMWLFFVLAVLLKRKTGSVVFYSFVLALGILATKAIFVLFLLPLFLLEKEKIKFCWPLVLSGAISVALLYATVGTEFLQPVGEAGTLRAPNVVSVINPWLFDSVGMGESFWNWAGLLCTLLAGSLAALRWRDEDFIVSASKVFVVMYATLMIVQQSAYSNYIFIFLLPFTLLLTNFRDRKQVAFLVIYNVLCTVHPSFWWRSGMPKYYSPGAIFESTASVIDYSMQLSIVLFTVCLILYTLKSSGTPSKE